MPVLLRPLTLGELLDRVFQIYRSRFAILVGIAAVAYVPIFLFQLLTAWMPHAASRKFGLAEIAGFLVLLVLRLLAAVAAMAATIIVVSTVYLDRPITVGEAYRRVSGMLVRVFFIMIGMSIGIGIGLLLLIVPGIILALMWSLAVPVAVLEDTGLGDSLSRSRYLTAGHRGRVFAIYLLYFAILIALEFGIGVPVGAIAAVKGASAAAFLRSSAGTLVGLIFGFIVGSLVTPVLTISLSLMYYDERVRKEAFDIQLMMNALDQAPPAASTAATV
jgi:hypothetical protein